MADVKGMTKPAGGSATGGNKTDGNTDSKQSGDGIGKFSGGELAGQNGNGAGTTTGGAATDPNANKTPIVNPDDAAAPGQKRAASTPTEKLRKDDSTDERMGDDDGSNKSRRTDKTQNATSKRLQAERDTAGKFDGGRTDRERQLEEQVQRMTSKLKLTNEFQRLKKVAGENDTLRAAEDMWNSDPENLDNMKMVEGLLLRSEKYLKPMAATPVASATPASHNPQVPAAGTPMNTGRSSGGAYHTDEELAAMVRQPSAARESIQNFGRGAGGMDVSRHIANDAAAGIGRFSTGAAAGGAASASGSGSGGGSAPQTAKPTLFDYINNDYIKARKSAHHAADIAKFSGGAPPTEAQLSQEFFTHNPVDSIIDMISGVKGSELPTAVINDMNRRGAVWRTALRG